MSNEPAQNRPPGLTNEEWRLIQARRERQESMDYLAQKTAEENEKMLDRRDRAFAQARSEDEQKRGTAGFWILIVGVVIMAIIIAVAVSMSNH